MYAFLTRVTIRWHSAEAGFSAWLKLGVWIWMQVAWQKSDAVQQVWRVVVALLAYPHLWVRKAAGRLVGLLLSTAKLGTAQTFTLPHHSCLVLSVPMSVTG
jgi:hypothetical protein